MVTPPMPSEHDDGSGCPQRATMSDGPDSARKVGQIVLPRTVLLPLQATP